MEGSPHTESIDASAYYIWEVPGKPVTIYLSHEAIDRILGEAAHVPEGASSDAEIGGILLGAAESGDRLTVRIEDAAPLPIRYTFGPSYLLAEEDQADLRAALEQWAPTADGAIYAVGFFRTHRRSGLGLTEDDLWLLENYFGDPSNVAMLIKPRPMRSSLAGFFFSEQGRIQAESSYLEFPIRARRSDHPATQPAASEAPAPVDDASPQAPLRDIPLPAFLAAAFEEKKKRHWWSRAPKDGAEPPAVEPPATAEAAPEPPPERTRWWKRFGRKERRQEELVEASGDGVAPPLPEETPQPARPKEPRWVSWWVQAPLLAALWLVVGSLGYLAAPKVRTPPPYSLEAPREPYALSLLVVEYGDNLCLTWDRHAPAVRLAERAVLWITDGDTSRSINLEAHMLRNPDFGVTYHRVTGQVKFRLDVVLPKERILSETWDMALHANPAAISSGGRARER